ncbi:MAG: pseudouridine synthase [Candidatus Bipolaricaulia bacterium]
MRITAKQRPRDVYEVAQTSITQFDLLDRECHVPPFRSRSDRHYRQEGPWMKPLLACTRRCQAVSLEAMTDSVNGAEPKRLLQWVQRHAGLSRRKAQELIASGEVSVNGVTVTDPFVMLRQDEIHQVALRGHPLPTERPEPRIYRYHKPDGVLCSHDDRFYGNTVGRVLRSEGFVGYTWAGRLDRDAAGLLLLTNDGDLVNVLTHPRYEVRKVYHVWLSRPPNANTMRDLFASMRDGIVDDGDRLCIQEGRIEGRPAHATVTLAEGKKHEVKRLFAHFGLDVARLARVAIGPVDLGDLKPGNIARLPSEAEAAVFEYSRSRLDGS